MRVSTLVAMRELLHRRVLQQVAAGAGHHRLHHVAVLGRDGQDDHACERGLLEDPARGLDARDARHVQVHHDHVRRQLRGQLHAVLAVRRLAHHVQLLGLQQVAEAAPEELVVVDQDYADLVGLGRVIDRHPA
jgi:hypothetical protein